MLAKIRDFGAQAILMYGLADTTPIVARQMIETGIAGRIPLVGNGEFDIAATIKAVPAALEGAVEAAAWLPAWDSPRSKAFVEAFTKEYGEAPGNHAYVHWEAVHLLAKAADGADSIEQASVCDALKAIRYDSAVGEVTFDDHNQARLPMTLLRIENGVPSIKGSLTAPSGLRLPMTPEQSGYR